MEWSPWQPWSKCDVKTCGKGTRSRKRTCYTKDTQQPAIGCKGLDDDYETCHVTCTTTTTTPPPTTTAQPVVLQGAQLENNTTYHNNMDSSRRGVVNVLFGHYENQAREWIRHRTPWVYQWLDSVEGRIGFALMLAVLSFIIVLIAWYCG